MVVVFVVVIIAVAVIDPKFVEAPVSAYHPVLPSFSAYGQCQMISFLQY